ncbi:MAG: TetR/AcrR family transcriptional regulator [Solirubrobacterales bacterium]
MTEAKRQKILVAMLAVVGEQGYERASVQTVLDRAGLYRQAFYDHFASKEDCFAVAYEEAATAVEAEVRVAAGRGGWEGQLRAGLGRLLELLDDDPVLGRALLVEVHPAGGRPLARRQLALRRAAAFLERGATEGFFEAPALTPEATAAGIHSVLHSRLASGRGELRELRGELMYVAVLPYRGAAAAAAAMARN